MTQFLITSAIAMVVLLAVYYLLLQREKMHRFNRFYLLAALVFSLAVPCITITVYKEAPAVVAAPEPVAKASMQTPSIQELPQPFTPHLAQQLPIAAPVPKINYWPYVVWGVYVLGALFFALRFVLNIISLYRLARRNDKVPVNGATLVLLDECPMPYTFMQYIFVCKKDYARKAIEHELLVHETTHVHQRHTLDILFVEALKTLLWFNLFLYAYKNAIQLNHEFLADEKTLNQFNNIPTYQQMLLDKAIPHSNHLLASSINFSITKKRFIMMTKTTSTIKGIVLKTTMLPVAAGLLYFLSTETILYAKNPNSTDKTILSVDKPVDGLLPEMAPAENGTTAVVEVQADTVVGDSRRDEYFKGVKIVINDKQHGVYIDSPYEKLALEHKRFYLNDVPEKKVTKPISQEDYDFIFSQNAEKTLYYLDEKKIIKDELLKYKREDFAHSAFRMRGISAPDGKMVQQFQMFLFTRPFYEKNIKHLSDHYPAPVYNITITDKPIDTTKEGLEEENKRDANDKTAYQRDEDVHAEKLKADHYDYVGTYVEASKDISPQFPGGRDAFEAYLKENLKLPEATKDKNVYVIYDVNTDGSISDVHVPEIDDEASKKEIERVFTASPRWIPGQKNGKALKFSTGIELNKKKK